MITYFDASAIVKRYTREVGGDEIAAAMSEAAATVTAVITGAQVPAALAKAIRTGALGQAEAERALADFWRDWAGLFRLRVDEPLIRRAAELAWRFGLRGYDAVHLASCSVYAEGTRESVRLATFDRQLAHAAHGMGMETLPANLD